MSLSNNLKRHGRSISDICGMGLDRIKLGTAAYLKEANAKVVRDHALRLGEIEIEFVEDLAALQKRANKLQAKDIELANMVIDSAFDSKGNVTDKAGAEIFKALRSTSSAKPSTLSLTSFDI